MTDTPLKKPGRGGARAGAGRKLGSGTVKARNITVYLTERDEHELVRALQPHERLSELIRLGALELARRRLLDREP